MSKLIDTHTVEASVDPTQTNESDGKVWHTPTLTTWEVPEVTAEPISAGT